MEVGLGFLRACRFFFRAKGITPTPGFIETTTHELQHPGFHSKNKEKEAKAAAEFKRYRQRSSVITDRNSI
jgi:hypothetical protein